MEMVPEEGFSFMPSDAVTNKHKTRSKLIVIKWIPGKYMNSMVVIQSTHPDFKEGDHFEITKFNNVLSDGYLVVAVPAFEEEKDEEEFSGY